MFLDPKKITNKNFINIFPQPIFKHYVFVLYCFLRSTKFKETNNKIQQDPIELIIRQKSCIELSILSIGIRAQRIWDQLNFIILKKNNI